jgi:CubicO group peptidase (beta-lactamase class C family)
VKRSVQWAALVLLGVGVVGFGREPHFWKRYLAALFTEGDALPISLYTPRELVSGGNQPPAPRVAPELESLDPRALAAAADYAGQHHSRALIVSRHGHLVFERYWQGTTFDTLEDSRSFGRVLLALAAGIAISEHKIGWPDEPIGYVISEWRDDPRGTITVRNLLQMSSGLAPSGSSLNPWGSAAREAFEADIVAQYLRTPLALTPGKGWFEQSTDPQLLALVLERATGQRYAQYLSRSLWQRIGAADAWLWLDRAGGAAHVDHGLLAHQGDWIRVAELLLKDGRYQGDEIIVPGWVTQMLAPAKTHANYGSYLRLGSPAAAGATPYATDDVFVVDGNGNWLWLVPSMQIAVLCTGDARRGPDWDDARVPNLIVRGARDFVPPPARPGADLSKLVPHH